MNEVQVGEIARRMIGFCQRVRVEAVETQQYVPLELVEMWADQIREAVMLGSQRGASWSDIRSVVQSFSVGSQAPRVQSRGRGRQRRG